MTAMSALCKIRFPAENFFKFSPYCVLPRHSQIMEHTATGVLFIEFHDLHLHLDPVLDSVYIAGSCRFRFYFFFGRDFVVPLTHPLFDPFARTLHCHSTVYGSPLPLPTSSSSNSGSSPSDTTGGITSAGPFHFIL